MDHQGDNQTHDAAASPSPTQTQSAPAAATAAGRKRWATPAEWATHRQTIITLYEGERLRDVMLIMERDHNFYATSKMYKDRLKKWNIVKNAKHPTSNLTTVNARRRQAAATAAENEVQTLIRDPWTDLFFLVGDQGVERALHDSVRAFSDFITRATYTWRSNKRTRPTENPFEYLAHRATDWQAQLATAAVFMRDPEQEKRGLRMVHQCLRELESNCADQQLPRIFDVGMAAMILRNARLYNAFLRRVCDVVAMRLGREDPLYRFTRAMVCLRGDMFNGFIPNYCRGMMQVLGRASQGEWTTERHCVWADCSLWITMLSVAPLDEYHKLREAALELKEASLSPGYLASEPWMSPPPPLSSDITSEPPKPPMPYELTSRRMSPLPQGESLVRLSLRRKGSIEHLVFRPAVPAESPSAHGRVWELD